MYTNMLTLNEYICLHLPVCVRQSPSILYYPRVGTFVWSKCITFKTHLSIQDGTPHTHNNNI